MSAKPDLARTEWLAARRRGIGGSDAAAVLGINPWKSPLDVWLEKTGEYSDKPDGESEPMYWGRILEDIVAREFEARTGHKVRRRTGIIRSKQHEFMLANVDRMLVGGKAGLECKTSSGRNEDEWDGQVPPRYYAQVQHYMAVTGCKEWHLAVLLGGQKFAHYHIPYDAAFVAELIDKERQFWQLVETRTPPMLDGTEATTRALKARYPLAQQGKQIDLPHEAFELILRYDEAAAREAQAGLEKDEAANRLRDMLGDAEVGQIHGRKVTWKNVTSSRLDTSALKAAHPDMYEFYTVSSTTRRFAIK